MTLQFDAETHTYTLDGVKLTSVTQALQAAGLVDLHGTPEQIGYAADLGTAAHIATELDDLGTLDEGTVAEEVWPYLRAWRKFRAEAGFVPEHIELRLHHPAMLYAGTIDRIGSLRSHRALIDIKTGAPRRTTGLQLAAYAEMAVIHGVARRGIRRYACHLTKDEAYTLVPYTDPRDLSVFMAALTLTAWRAAA